MASPPPPPPISRRFWGLLGAPTDEDATAAGVSGIDKTTLVLPLYEYYMRAGWTRVTILLPSSFQEWASEAPMLMVDAVAVISIYGSPPAW